ncbi:uroporphyrinogen-III synthase [Methylovulum psychrotolerans]|uniref:Uroporphyrinogen-III synthase n=1 Tax=Methylovulum psychrotolerans TaxID=1704499 RepID=A0A1Z4BXA5_9GAMM|nr:uroporphyrinogen-III synthase [Methylovulum psychrotolerans]ASF45892.1 uroporphyrinogen III synthase [Methylovulum psychrotolerans]
MSGLGGAGVLVTRPAHQAEVLCRLIAEQGGTAIRFPTLAIEATADTVAVQTALANLGNFQWLIFISANAVNFALKANGGKIPKLIAPRLAAIGQSTAQALANSGLGVDLVPAQGFNSEALLAEPLLQQVGGQRILIVRGEGGREELAAQLRHRGAEVSYIDVYKRVMPDNNASEVQALLTQQRLQAITITSGEALQNLLMMVAPAYHPLLTAIPVIVVSGRLAQMANNLGFKHVVVAEQPADSAMIKAVTMCLTGK